MGREKGARGLEPPVWEETLRALERSIPHYERVNRVISLGLGPALRRRLVEAAGVSPGMRVVDVGCGPGYLAGLAAARMAGRGTVACVDPSEVMLGQAGRNLAGIGVDVLLIRGSFEDLPLPDGWADAVLCSYSLRDAVDRRRGLREALRVLSPGGVFGVVDVTRPDSPAADAVVRAHIGLLAPILAAAVTGELRNPWWALRDTYVRMWRSSELVDEVARLFEVESVERVFFGAMTSVVARRPGTGRG